MMLWYVIGATVIAGIFEDPMWFVAGIGAVLLSLLPALFDRD